ncbi:hypothetical protein PDJAM_G00167190, partial [Pangasius djambal]|nr:hypothetical protein [Pangasius djambal]
IKLFSEVINTNITNKRIWLNVSNIFTLNSNFTKLETKFGLCLFLTFHLYPAKSSSHFLSLHSSLLQILRQHPAFLPDSLFTLLHLVLLGFLQVSASFILPLLHLLQHVLTPFSPLLLPPCLHFLLPLQGSTQKVFVVFDLHALGLVEDVSPPHFLFFLLGFLFILLSQLLKTGLPSLHSGQKLFEVPACEGSESSFCLPFLILL